MLVEGSGEVALEQLVVVDGLGDDSTHELEIAEMVGVAVARSVDSVGDPVSRTGAKESIVGVEDFS